VDGGLVVSVFAVDIVVVHIVVAMVVSVEWVVAVVVV
jgi:hypothetical protein